MTDHQPIDPKTIRAVITMLIAERVDLNLHLVHGIDGDDWISLGVDRAMDWLNDKDAFFRKEYGVSHTEYEAFQEAGGVVQCSATTRQGHCCKGWAPGRTESPKEWVDRMAAGELCTVHAKG